MINHTSKLGEHHARLVERNHLTGQGPQIINAPARVLLRHLSQRLILIVSHHHGQRIQIKLVIQAGFINHAVAVIGFVVTPKVNIHKLASSSLKLKVISRPTLVRSSS